MTGGELSCLWWRVASCGECGSSGRVWRGGGQVGPIDTNIMGCGAVW